MKLAILATAAAVTLASAASAGTFSFDYNIEGIDSGPVLDDSISLPGIVSIDSISIDIAHTWGNDLVITLTSPTGDVFDLMNGEFSGPGGSGSGNFDMGLVAGSSALANVDTYTFVESGGLTEWTAPFSAGGTYDANTWASGGWAAGDWALSIFDSFGGDPTSIGNVTINYTIPAPGAIALLGLAGLAGARRRRA